MSLPREAIRSESDPKCQELVMSAGARRYDFDRGQYTTGSTDSHQVRCDAAADDGSIKTCSNCQKAGLICGYNRVPMKRGPSKGWDKYLYRFNS